MWTLKQKNSRPLCVDMEKFDKVSEAGVGREYGTLKRYYDLLYQQKNNICRYTNLLSIFSVKKLMVVTLGDQGIVTVGESLF